MQNDHTTIFATPDFVESWCRALGECEPFIVRVQGSGPPRTMHLVKTPMRYGSFQISRAQARRSLDKPWLDRPAQTPRTVEHILDQLTGLRTRSLLWQVRFDHEPLALILCSLGLIHDRVQVHVLNLDRDYSQLFARYNATTRNHVRKAARRGVIVRSTCDAQDVFAYHAIYSRHARRNNWGFEYPAQITLDMIKLAETASAKACFKVAEHEDAIIGGALFLRDGNSVYYLHEVADREYSHLFPASSVLDAGIQWACQSGAQFFNFGNSGIDNVNESLAAFKSSWGAQTERNWLFKWDNPVWKSAAKLKSSVRRIKAISSPISNNGEYTLSALPWSQRARFDELRAVCSADETETKNIIMHGATVEGAETVLSLTRKQKFEHPIVLDFGCGTGRMIRFFAERRCNVVGLDVTLEMLEAAKKHGLPAHSLLAHFDGESIPLQDCSVDIVWVCGVLKYTLFPPGTRCLHGIAQPFSSKRFIPTCPLLAKEMFRVVRPGAIVAQCEVWIDKSPDVFRQSFEQAGFIAEQVRLLRRDYDYLERVYLHRASTLIPPLLTSRLRAKLRYHFDDPRRGGFRDYLIIWRKPLEAGRTDLKGRA